LRNLPSCALLKLSTGGIWFLRTIGYLWTDERVATAARTLEAHGEALEPDALSLRLVEDLELPSIKATKPSSAELGGSTWDLRRHAVASCLDQVFAKGSPNRPAPSSVEVEKRVAQLEQRLQSSLKQFRDALDPDAVRLASRCGEIDPDVYNYLAHVEHGRNRQQFAAVLPLFLRAVVRNGDASPFREIRSAIDRGQPLVEAAARAMDVKPSAVRALIGQSIEACGPAWESTPDRLTQLLDTIRPEARPSASTQSWRSFREVVEIAERTLGQGITSSFFGWTFVRAALYSKRAPGQPGSRPVFDARVAAVIDLYHDDLVRVVEAEMGESAARARTVRTETIRRSVTHFLRSGTLRKLGATAMRWHHEYDEARARDDNLAKYLRGDCYWPITPSPHPACNGFRRLVPLVSSRELQEHGKAMGICLADTQLRSYDVACRKGRAFVVAVLDAVSAQPRSTVELSATRVGNADAIRVQVVQHTGRGNCAPSATCRQAVHELLDALSGETLQRHLRIGVNIMLRSRVRRIGVADKADVLAKVRAFRRTLGDVEYEAFVRSHLGSDGSVRGANNWDTVALIGQD
jgi:hypothetical protein